MDRGFLRNLNIDLYARIQFSAPFKEGEIKEFFEKGYSAIFY